MCVQLLTNIGIPLPNRKGKGAMDKMDNRHRPLTADMSASFKSCASHSFSSHLCNTSIAPHCCYTLGPINGMDYVREALVLEGSLCPWPLSHGLSLPARLARISCRPNANTVGQRIDEILQKRPPAIQLPCLSCLLTGLRRKRVKAVCTWK